MAPWMRGPGVLPRSIIVTPEGTEGDAPIVEGRGGAQPAQEDFFEVEESSAPARPKVRTKSKKNSATRAGKANQQSHSGTGGAHQMMLGFDKRGDEKKRNSKNGKKHGAKKAKK